MSFFSSLSSHLAQRTQPKITAWTLSIVFCLSIILQYLFPWLEQVVAETTVDHTNIVAVFVDEEVLETHQADIVWYTSRYIQSREQNTVALTIPVATDQTHPTDILNVIESLYFQWYTDRTSQLQGIVLIGDIPLPVVDNNTRRYPSMSPYTDLVDPQYLRDSNQRFFVLNERAQVSQYDPELWHGWIWDENNQYSEYFRKLRQYDQDPLSYVARKMWYDDFVHLKDTFSFQLAPLYYNKAIFAEDIMYHRFTNVFANFLNKNYTDSVTSSFFDHEWLPTEGIPEADAAANQAANDFFGQFEDVDQTALESATQNTTPTILLQQNVQQFLADYNQLVGTNYLVTMRDRVNAWGRRDNTKIDSHVRALLAQDTILYGKDQVVSLFKEVNDSLQSGFVQTIRDAGYQLRVPIPTRFVHEENQIETDANNLSCRKPWYQLNGDFEIMYAWANAKDIESLEELTTVRGTFFNVNDITPLQAMTLWDRFVFDQFAPLSSVWVSYKTFDTQVDANRLWSSTAAQQDAGTIGTVVDNFDDIFFPNNTYEGTNRAWRRRKEQCAEIDVFQQRYRWGYTPVNLVYNDTTGENELKFDLDPQFPRSPSYMWWVIDGRLYDISGSKETTWDMSYPWTLLESITELWYAHKVRQSKQTRFSLDVWLAWPVLLPILNALTPSSNQEVIVSFCTPENREIQTLQRHDFFTIFDNTSNQEWVYNLMIVEWPNNAYQQEVEQECSVRPFLWLPIGWAYRDKYSRYYKTIDSVVIHDSPTPNQTAGMDIATPDRPIDSNRRVEFIGLAWDDVSLVLPNIYEVPIYTSTGERKSVADIAEAIELYLRLYVQSYNTELQAQLDGKNAFYTSRQDAFDALQVADPFATPNRSYNLLPDNYFVDMLGDTLIQEVAEALYDNAAMRPRMEAQANPVAQREMLSATADINHRFGSILESYLTRHEGGLATPTYNTTWYELAYINTDGYTYLSSDEVPNLILQLQDAQRDNWLRWRPNLDDVVTWWDNESCGYSTNIALPLIQLDGDPISPRREWFKCWIQETLNKPFELRIHYDNAQWPVFDTSVLWRLDEVANAWDLADLWIQWANNNLDTTIAWQEQQWEEYDAQRTAQREAEQEAQTILERSEPARAQELSEARYGFQPQLWSPLVSVIPDPETLAQQFVRLSSLTDHGETQVAVSSTGANCLIITDPSTNQDVNSCQTPFVITKNWYTTEIQLPYQLESSDVWPVTVLFDLCLPDETWAIGDVCTTKTQKLTVIPGPLEAWTIETPVDTVVTNSKTPVIAHGYDRYGNAITQADQLMQITANTGSLNAEFSRFPYKGTFTAPANPALATLTLSWINAQINVVQPVTSIDTGLVSYTLPDTWDDIKPVDSNGLPQVQTWALPFFTIDITDGQWQSLTANARIYAVNGKMRPWIARVGYTATTTPDGVYDAFAQSQWEPKEHRTISWSQIVTLMPSMHIGEDQIIIEVEWQEPIALDVVVHPGSPYAITLVSETDTLQENETTDMTVSVADAWGNLIEDETSVRIGALWPLDVQPSLTSITWPTQITVTGQEPWGRGFVYAMLPERAISDQIPAVQELIVQNTVMPLENLNVMYLNLRWRAWWNIWQEESVQTLFSTSERLLALTTQIYDPTQWWDIVYSVHDGFDQDWSLTRANDLTLEHDEYGSLVFSGPNNVTLVNNAANLASLTSDQWQYVPEISDTRFFSNTIANNGLVINGIKILDRTSGAVESGVVIQNNGTDQRWVLRDNNIVGTLHGLIDTSWLTEDAISSDLLWTQTRSEGSTHSEMSWVALSRDESRTDHTSSVQDSKNIDDHQWFFAPFQNISSRANDHHVWESTRLSASDLLINFWDPFVSRIDPNDQLESLPFDIWPGKTVGGNPDKSIFKALHTDINNDGLKELLTVYQDGWIHLSKNYGGTDPWVEIWPLMLIQTQIADARAWDINGDEYNDIVIQTDDDRLFVYYNTNGVFDVDGYPVCLPINDEPHRITGVRQLFVHDMDADGSLDLVTNARGRIEIFYGWQDGSLTSLIQDGCDAERSTRQESLLVKEFGVQIMSWLQIVDDSLIRRNGLSTGVQAIENDTSQRGFDPNEIVDPNTGVPDISQFDVSGLTDQAWSTAQRWQASPVTTKPLNDSDTDLSDITYIPLDNLLAEDGVVAYKSYHDTNGGVLRPGDNVTVTITVETNKWPVTFIDHVRWPWIVHNTSQWLSGWTTDNILTGDLISTSINENNNLYMLDEIRPINGNRVSRSYDLEYADNEVSLVDIRLDDENNDNLTDIKVYPQDGCFGMFWTFINNTNNNNRWYNEEVTDFAEEMSNEHANLNDQYTSTISAVTNTINDAIANQDLSALDDIMGETEVRWKVRSIVKDAFANGGLNGWVLDLGFNPELEASINEWMDEILDGLCHGFNPAWGGCQWPPVPFNMAFLAPGTFNVMGCRLMDDPGMPAFWLGSAPPVIPAPVVPYGLVQRPKPDSWWYFGLPPGWGSGPTLLRIYLAPTLTMQLWLAVCLGPYDMAGIPMPVPFGDIAGNCIVTKIPLPDDMCHSDGDGEWIDPSWQDGQYMGDCPSVPVTPENPSDLPLSSPSSSPFATWSAADDVPYDTPRLRDGEYGFGLINIDTSPTVVTSDTFNADMVSLEEGPRFETAIKWWLSAAKGIAQCVVGDWIDEQTKYVLNNLTTMTLGIYLPDVTQLVQGFDTLNSDNRHETMEDIRLTQQDPLSRAQLQANEAAGSEEADATRISEWPGSAVRNSWVEQQDVMALSNPLSNPFETISELFTQVPLINVNTQDINIQVPMIYAEDINRYTQYLKTRSQEQRDILLQWEGLLQSSLGICGKHFGVSDLEDIDPSLNGEALKTQVTDQANNVRETAYALRDQITEKIDELKACQNNPASCGRSAQDIELEIDGLQSELGLTNDCVSFFFGTDGNSSLGINNNLSAYFDFSENSQELIDRVNQNIQILHRYKQFPLQLHEWLHSTDRHLSELSAAIADLIADLNLWLETNARRFEQYVDSLVIIIQTLKSRQAIIDLSVNRSEQCSTCTNDNYNYYSCSFGVLCPELPIIPIPPFKIPSIYLDLSNIDASMDILLPQFNFVPTSVPLPSLPNLPRPPQVSADFDINLQGEMLFDIGQELLANTNRAISEDYNLTLPQIPVLPAPPELPPIPSFVPGVDLSLPVLPPAPKIPKLPTSISTTIKVADTIGKLMCTVKQGVGLVKESRVKTRIEQLTQRTRDIPIFDDVDLTQEQFRQPLQGFDIKVESFVRFQYNFDAVYSLLNSFADQINQTTSNLITTPTLDKVNDVNGTINDWRNNELREIERQDTIQLNAFAPQDDSSYTHHTTEGLDLIDGQAQLATLQGMLARAGQLHDDMKTAPRSDDKTIADHNQVQIALQELQEVTQQSRDLVSHKQWEISAYADLVDRDYEAFLSSLASDKLVSSSRIETTLHTSLLQIDDTTAQYLTDNNPWTLLLDQYESLIDGYAETLSQWPQAVWLDEETYKAVDKELSYLSEGTQALRDILQGRVQESDMAFLLQATDHRDASRRLASFADRPSRGSLGTSSSMCSYQAQPEEQAALDLMHQVTMGLPQYAQTNGTSTSSTTSQESIMSRINLASYLKGIYIENNDNKIVNIVASDTYANDIGDRYQLLESSGNTNAAWDSNNDNKDDVLLRNDDHIWIKYADQNDIYDVWYSYLSDRVVTPTISSEWLAELREDDEGIRNDISLSHYHFVVPNFRVNGQWFDNLSISWTNSTMKNPDIAWYVLRYTQRVDVFDTRWETRSYLTPEQDTVHYALVLPGEVNTESTLIDLGDELTLDRIDNYMTGTITHLSTYNEWQSTVTLNLTDIPRQWHYLQVAPLTSLNEGNRLTQQWPWSNQIVGWPQRLADEIPPTPQVRLLRKTTNNIVDEWLDLQWYVSTNYDVLIKWEDNIDVASNSVIFADDTIMTNTGGVSVISGLWYEDIDINERTITAVDVNGNEALETLALDVIVPEISLTDILTWVILEWTLDQDIDSGQVLFEKKRHGYRETLTGTTPTGPQSLRPVTVGQTVATGWLYETNPDVILINENGEEFARLDKDNGQVLIYPNYITRYDTTLDLSLHYPSIVVVDKTTNTDSFRVYLHPISLSETDITITGPNYRLVDLDQPSFGVFANGRCIQDFSGQCHVYLAPSGEIYIPDPFHQSMMGDYVWDTINSKTIYRLAGVADISFEASVLE